MELGAVLWTRWRYVRPPYDLIFFRGELHATNRSMTQYYHWCRMENMFHDHFALKYDISWDNTVIMVANQLGNGFWTVWWTETIVKVPKLTETNSKIWFSKGWNSLCATLRPPSLIVLEIVHGPKNRFFKPIFSSKIENFDFKKNLKIFKKNQNFLFPNQ